MSNELLKKVIVAVDVPDFDKAREIVNFTKDYFEFVKIGMQGFYGYGEKIIPYAQDKGFKIFLDLKLCDIPNTVALAIKSLAKYRFDLLTVHINGGEMMLREAVKSLRDVLPTSGIIGVTILTSLSEDDLRLMGYRASLKDVLSSMAAMAVNTNLYGIVCSALDIEEMKNSALGKLKIITPGIRLPSDEKTDQKRVETPKKAFELGADFIVMGRPIIDGDIKANIDRLIEHLGGIKHNGR